MKKYFEIRDLLKIYGVKKILGAVVKEIYRKFWLELIKNSYAQCGEDLIVENIFNKKFVGKYLEIGAYHPTRLSNTYRFYKKGWRGIVVEPNPEVKDIFNKLRPEDKFCNFGISNDNRILNYFQFLIPALNTFSKKEADISIKNGHKLKKIIKITTKTVNEILKKNIDYLSIDTEGFDEKILKKWNWNKCRPVVICVETDKKSNIDKLMKEKCYEKYFENKFNSIYVLKKLKPGDGHKQ